MTDTIYALASATGKAGVSVLRVSGPKVMDVATSMLGFCPKQRNASFVRINDQNGD